MVNSATKLALGVAVGVTACAAVNYFFSKWTFAEVKLIGESLDLIEDPTDEIDGEVIEDLKAGTKKRRINALWADGTTRGPFWSQLVIEARLAYRGAKWNDANATSLARFCTRYCEDKGVRKFDLEQRLSKITIAVFWQTREQRMEQEIRRKGLRYGVFKSLFH